MKIVGHRGATNEYPENTSDGFHQAFINGIRCFELDVHAAADGTPVIIHDRDTTRTTEANQIVKQSSSASLIALGIPTLLELLPLFDQCDHVQLEIKDSPIPIFAFLQKHFNGRDISNYYITSDDVNTLQIANTMLPSVSRGVVFDPSDTPIDYVGIADRYNCQMVVAADDITQEEITTVQDAGLTTSIYTINDLKKADWCEQQGIDYLITDIPITVGRLRIQPDQHVASHQPSLAEHFPISKEHSEQPSHHQMHPD